MKKKQEKYESPVVRVIACETEGVFLVSRSEYSVRYTEDVDDDEAQW